MGLLVLHPLGSMLSWNIPAALRKLPPHILLKGAALIANWGAIELLFGILIQGCTLGLTRISSGGSLFGSAATKPNVAVAAAASLWFGLPFTMFEVREKTK